MQIGIGLPNLTPGINGRALLAWARRAEERGFSSLATGDRVAYPTYESLVSLSAVAAVTERIGLVTNILLAPTRQAILLAKEAASVDQISAGRLTLGLAVGARRDDYEATGQEFSERGRRFDEDLALLHEAWRGNPVIADCEQPVTPSPTNGTNVPIIVGGTSEQTIDRIIRWGIGWTTGGSPETVAPFAERLGAAWNDSGKPGDPKIMAQQYFSLGDDVVEASKGFILDFYAALGEVAQGFAEYGVHRSPQAIRDMIHKFQDAGVDEFSLVPTVADLRQVDLLADVVS